MLFYEPHKRYRTLLPHDPFKALIAPRPIGWVSSVSKQGDINLAPYSFFIAFADKPDYATVAQSLGMPVGSIGPTRGRCLAKLRQALETDPRWEMPA